MASRKLIRDNERETLRQVNKKEVNALVERWSSSEFLKAMMDFMKK